MAGDTWASQGWSVHYVLYAFHLYITVPDLLLDINDIYVDGQVGQPSPLGEGAGNCRVHLLVVTK